MLQSSVTPLQTSRAKSSFYVSNNEVSIFISADFCVQSYLYTQQNEYVIKTFLILLPEDRKSSLISCIKVIQNTLYCFAYNQSESSSMSELFVYNLDNVPEYHQNLQQTQRFTSTNIKVNGQIRFFSITESLIGLVTESNYFYVYDINKGKQEFQKQFHIKDKQIADISGYYVQSSQIFALIAENTIILISKSYNITEIKPSEQKIIQQREPDTKFHYVYVQTNNTDIIVVNNDGKTIEISEDGRVLRWQNIKENKLQAISSFIITKNDAHYEEQRKYKFQQIITFNKGIIKVNDMETFKFKGKVDVSKLFSVIQNQDIVNCYLFQEKTIIITEKCGIIVMKYMYDNKDKITYTKFQANYQGIYTDQILFGSNNAIGQYDQLLYIQNLASNTLTIHEHMVMKHKISNINGNYMFTLHLLENCTGKNIATPLYNIQSDNKIGQAYCISKYNIEAKMYQYFTKIPFPDQQIDSMKSHLTNDQQELLVFRTKKSRLIVLLSIFTDNRHICYIIPDLQAKYYDVTYDYVKQCYTIIYFNMKDDLMYIQFTIQDFIKQTFTPKLLQRNPNLHNIFHFSFYKDMLFLGVTLIDKQSNIFQNKVQVYHIKQLQKMSKFYDNKKQINNDTFIQPLDELLLNVVSNSDAIPIGMQINEFTDYITCVVAIQYQKCTKLYSLISKESLQTFFQLGDNSLTTDYFIINMKNSYHVYKIDESLLQNTSLFTYLYTDTNEQEQNTFGEYQLIIQDMIDKMSYINNSQRKSPITVEKTKSTESGLKDLRSRLTDQQQSVLMSQLRPELHEDLNEQDKQSKQDQISSKSAMKIDDLVISKINNNEQSSESLSYKPDDLVESRSKSKKIKNKKNKQKKQNKQENKQHFHVQSHSQVQATQLNNLPLDKLRQVVSNTIKTKFTDPGCQSMLFSDHKSSQLITNSMQDISKTKSNIQLERCVSESRVCNPLSKLIAVEKSTSSQNQENEKKVDDPENIFQRISHNIEYESLLSSEPLSFQSDGQIEFNNEQLSLQLKQNLDALDEQEARRATEQTLDDAIGLNIDEHVSLQGATEIQASNAAKSPEQSRDKELEHEIKVETPETSKSQKNSQNEEINQNKSLESTNQPQNSTPAQLGQSMSLQLLNGLQLINQNLSQTVKHYEISSDGFPDDELEKNKHLIKKEVDLLSNTLERIHVLLGIESDDSVKNQLKNLTATIMGLTRK